MQICSRWQNPIPWDYVDEKHYELIERIESVYAVKKRDSLYSAWRSGRTDAFALISLQIIHDRSVAFCNFDASRYASRYFEHYVAVLSHRWRHFRIV